MAADAAIERRFSQFGRSRRSAAPPSGGATGGGAPNVLRDTLGLTAASPTGKGIGIAILDSGIVPSKDFDGRIMRPSTISSRRAARFATAYDDYGHGTHIAGLIGSSGAQSQPVQGCRARTRA